MILISAFSLWRSFVSIRKISPLFCLLSLSSVDWKEVFYWIDICSLIRTTTVMRKLLINPVLLPEQDLGVSIFKELITEMRKKSRVPQHRPYHWSLIDLIFFVTFYFTFLFSRLRATFWTIWALNKQFYVLLCVVIFSKRFLTSFCRLACGFYFAIVHICCCLQYDDDKKKRRKLILSLVKAEMCAACRFSFRSERMTFVFMAILILTFLKRHLTTF